MSLPAALAWPFFDDAHRALAQGARDWSAQALHAVAHDDVDATCRGLVRGLGDGRLAALLRAGSARRRPAATGLARAVPVARDLRLSRWSRGLRLRDAGTRQRRDHVGRHAGAAGGAPAARRARRTHHRLRAVGARCRVRRRRDDVPRTAHRGRLAARRREDLDLQRRDRRPLHGVRAQRRGGDAARVASARCSCRPPRRA